MDPFSRIFVFDISRVISLVASDRFSFMREINFKSNVMRGVLRAEINLKFNVMRGHFVRENKKKKMINLD